MHDVIRAAIVATLVLAGCATVTAAATPSAARDTSPVPDRTAGPAALRPIDRDALQSLVDAGARELLVPGAVVLLRTPQVEITVAHGTTQLGATSPPRGDTHFRIASNTKTMTAAVVLQLAQEGKLRLDDPIAKYVAGIPDGERITLGELLEMRSGLYGYTEAPELAATLDRDPARIWTPDELLAIALAHPRSFPPGAEFQYNNTNYLLLGLVVERVDGRPLARALHDRLFAPLRMEQTELPPSASTGIPEPYAHGYLYGSSSVALTGTPPYTPEMRAAAEAGTLLPTDYTSLNHSFAAAAGGVVSTADDLATWIHALVSGRVLDAEYQRRWLDSPRPEDPSKPDGQRYGYGIARMSWGPNRMYFHGGETPGFNSFMGHDPVNRVTLVVWTNLTVSLDERPTANSLMLRVLDRLYVVSPLSPAPSPATSGPTR